MIQPKKTTIEYELGRGKSHSEVVVLTMEDDLVAQVTGGDSGAWGAVNGFAELNIKTSISSNASSSANSIIGSNIQLQQAMLSNNASYASLISNTSPMSPLGAENVWKKRNLENAVIIPQETQIKSSNLF